MAEDIQTIILAGGMGTRIQSVAGDLPKSMIPVAGRPFIEHQLELLRVNGLSQVLLLTGYRGELIQQHVGDGSRWGMRVTYVQEDPDALLGTGGALVHALPHLEARFVTLYGDSYLPVDFQSMIAWYDGQDCPAVMSVFRNEGQWDRSNVRVEAGRVVHYSKASKPGEADHIDYGLSLFTREIMESYAHHSMPLDLAVIQGDLVARGLLAAYPVTQRFYEIGKPEGLAELEAYLTSGGVS